MVQCSLTAIVQVDPNGPIELEKFREAYLTRKSDQPLLLVLLEAWDAFTTDGRDEIFALMGRRKRETPGFVLDYSVSVEEVFINFS